MLYVAEHLQRHRRDQQGPGAHQSKSVQSDQSVRPVQSRHPYIPFTQCEHASICVLCLKRALVVARGTGMDSLCRPCSGGRSYQVVFGSTGHSLQSKVTVQ